MNKSAHFKRYTKGFALIEVAIALIVISVCLGGALKLIQLLQTHKQSSVSQQHEQVILAALNRFYHLNGYLPCPSSPNVNMGEALQQCRGAVEQVGVVPFKTLGIPDVTSRNGFGFYFTYAVSESVTITPNSLITPVVGNDLDIVDAHGRPYLATGSCFAFALVNHGSHGKGAFSLKSGRHRFAAENVWEQENATDSLRFCADTALPNQRVIFKIQHDLTQPLRTTVPTPQVAAPNPTVEADLEDPYANME